jgi:hypothetical protein
MCVAMAMSFQKKSCVDMEMQQRIIVFILSMHILAAYVSENLVV